MPLAAIAPIIGAGIGATTGIIGANKQSNAAKSAAQLQYQAEQDALAFQKSQWNQNQQNQAPWVKAGQQAVGQLSDLTSTPGQGLLAQWDKQFTAPTAAEAAATPGYQFALNQGLQGIERSAAARGNLLTGGLLQAEQQYGQGLASTTYQQTFNNALTQYQQAYNQFQQGQANTYNRLAGLAGLGQTSATTLGSQGQAASGNVGNILQIGAQQQGNNLQNAAYQSASGYNAAGSAISGGLNNLSQYYQLQGLLGGGTSNSNGGIPTIGTDFGTGYGTWGG